jgi:hypothetical protein
VQEGNSNGNQSQLINPRDVVKLTRHVALSL